MYGEQKKIIHGIVDGFHSNTLTGVSNEKKKETRSIGKRANLSLKIPNSFKLNKKMSFS